MVDQRGITPSEDSIGDALKHAAAATGATPLTSLEGYLTKKTSRA